MVPGGARAEWKLIGIRGNIMMSRMGIWNSERNGICGR